MAVSSVNKVKDRRSAYLNALSAAPANVGPVIPARKKRYIYQMIISNPNAAVESITIGSCAHTTAPLTIATVYAVITLPANTLPAFGIIGNGESPIMVIEPDAAGLTEETELNAQAGTTAMDITIIYRDE